MKGRSLLDVPELNARLGVLLGEERLTALGAMAVSSPVTESQGWILAAGCMPHNCGSEHYAVAVDTRSYDVLACVVRSRTGGPGSDVVWTGTDRRTVERTVEDADEACTWKTGIGDIKPVLD